MDFVQISRIEDEYQVTTYKKMPLAVERGSGPWIWTSDGVKYLDLYGGHAVCATGHSHPHVVGSIKAQADKILFYSNLVYSEARATAANLLAAVAPTELSKVFFCNSGTEANENAMRIARLATGREKVITFSGGFHGRTADSISATFLGRYRELGRPNVPGHEMAIFGDMESVRAIADEHTAAIMLEPIQSMAGVLEAPPNFFVELRGLCDQLGILLVFDEVQTGIGRIGNWFFSGSEFAGGAVPDVVTLAKSLGSGIPVGACLVRDCVAHHIKENDLGTTFGGGMIAMAAVRATLEAIKADGMVANARVFEQRLREGLRDIPQIRNIRGKGCLLGIELDHDAVTLHSRLLERRIITGTSSDKRVLRLLPPLNTGSDEIDYFIRQLKEIYV